MPVSHQVGESSWICKSRNQRGDGAGDINVEFMACKW